MFSTQHWLTPEVGAWGPELPLGQAGPPNSAPGQWLPKVGKTGLMILNFGAEPLRT